MSRPAVHAARDVDALLAAEWALEDLHAARSKAGRHLSAVPTAGSAATAADEERLRMEAEERARREAEREREEALKEAHRRGYEEGRLAGEEAEAARLRNVLQAAEQALDELREGEMRWTGAIEENVCALAVAVARQVIARELEGDVEAVMELVRRALAEFPIDQAVRIRVNPMDLSALESCAPGPGEPLPVVRGREARWVPDARVAPGGCVVEGRERIVDGRVDTALERIYRRLTYNHV